MDEKVKQLYVQKCVKMFSKFTKGNSMLQHYIHGYLALLSADDDVKKKKFQKFEKVIHRVYLLLKLKDKDFIKYLKNKYKNNINNCTLVLEGYVKK